MPRLQDAVIIVTGGGHGLGRAYCHALAAEGARVVAADIDGPATERVAGEIKEKGGAALPLAIDVSDEEQTREMARHTAERFGGRIDGLVNNAAIFRTVPLPRGSVEGISVGDWERVMAVNVRGVFLCCRAVVPYMKAQRYGKIVNISSTTALQGLASFGPYPTSKVAVLGITRGLARDLGQYNITVNSVAPGGTLSDDVVSEERREESERMLQFIPGQRLSGVTIRAMHRVETPQDLVGAIVFLCSRDSDFISGQTLVVDGGSYMT